VAEKIARLTDGRLRRRDPAGAYAIVLPIGDVTWVDFEIRIDDRIDSHEWVQRQHGSCHLAICLVHGDRRVKFKFRINRRIYQGFRISYSRDDVVVALTERDSRVYFGKADINALHFRDTGGTGAQKIMAHDCRAYVRGSIREGLSMGEKNMELTAVRIIGFNSTAIRFPAGQHSWRINTHKITWIARGVQIE
jgi:hypothetical protein